MLISWLTKFSLLDFPWEVSCIIFTAGCNMRCDFCYNSDFVIPEKIKKLNILREKNIFTFLESRKWLLTWVSICWGEPSLQKDLVEFCKKIKKIWFKIKLDTNGRDPVLLEKLLELKLVDYIAMDIKEDFNNFWVITNITESNNNYLKSITIIRESDIQYEFRTTVIKWFHNNDMIEKIAKLLKNSQNYYLQNYKNNKNILNKNFSGKPFWLKQLELFRKIANKYIKNVWIRE